MSYDIKNTLKSHFWRKTLSFCRYVRNVVTDVIMFPLNLLTTSGLSILVHGVISLLDATPFDNLHLNTNFNKKINNVLSGSVQQICCCSEFYLFFVDHFMCVNMLGPNFMIQGYVFFLDDNQLSWES